MDVETLRLEREEKRRQRRERIRKILEDDPSPTRRSREEPGSTTTARYTGASRRPRETVESSSTTERTRYSHRNSPEVSSARSTRTSRQRENISSTPSSTRSSLHTSEETTTRATTTARRMREERTSTPSERTHARSERTTRTTYTSSETSPTRTARTTRSSRQTTDIASEQTTVDSIRARREARRKRNQEHDDKQNKITLENGEIGTGTRGDHGRVSRSKEDAGQEKDNDSKSRDNEGKQAGDISSGDNLDKQGDLSSKESGCGVNKDETDISVVDETHRITQEEIKTESEPTETEKNAERATVEEHDTVNKDIVVDVKMNEASLEDSSIQNKQDESVENEGTESFATAESPVIEEKKHDEVIEKKETKDIDLLVEIENDSEVKKVEDTVDKEEKENNKSSAIEEVDDIKSNDNVEVVAIAVDLPDVKQDVENKDTSTTEDRQTQDVLTSPECDVEVNVVKRTLDEPFLQSTPSETAVDQELHGADNAPTSNEESAQIEEFVILEELPEITVLKDEISHNLPTEVDGKENKTEVTKDKTSCESDKVVIPGEAVVDDGPQESESIPNKQKTVSPVTSPKKSKSSATSDEDRPKSSKSRTKSDVSASKSDESGTKNERLRAKSDISGTRNDESGTKVVDEGTSESKSPIENVVNRRGIAESGTKGSESEPTTDKVSTKSEVARTKNTESGGKSSEDGPKASEEATKTSRTGKLKVGDDAWKKNVRKKKGVPDVDRAVELRVLGRTGKIKNKMKTCETRDVDSADQWKREVKKSPRKHKSFDEETEKELRELSSKRELKNIVQSCEENDRESADAWKREVKKNVRKHKSLDEDAENELKEISKISILKSRIKECEEKDKESADAWTKEVAKERKPKNTEAEAALAEDLKEFSGGRLKELISSCAERDEKKEKSWESAKEKVKSVDDEDELKELASLSEAKNKIIQQYEEMDKQSAESSLKKIKSGGGAKSFDETTDEELLELAKTVDVKTRIQSTLEDQPKEISKQHDPLEDEELKEINLKAKLEMFKQETEKQPENKATKTSSKTLKADTSGRKSPDKRRTSLTKGVSGRTSPTKGDSGRTSPTKGDSGRTSPTKGDSGRTSPTKDRSRSSSGRVSPSKDKARTSSTIGDNSGRVSPTKDRSRTLDDKSGQTTNRRDQSRTSSTVSDSSGRVSPSKDRCRSRADSGRTSPSKDNTSAGSASPTKGDTSGGRISPDKNKRATQGRRSPTKDNNTPAKSKLDSIRANLMDGGKNKTKTKRESLKKISESTSIKDKIAACKERDKAAPRTIVLPKANTSRAKTKPDPDKTTPDSDNVNGEAGRSDENEAPVPVNREGGQFTTIEEETQGASIKDALSFWKEPGAEKTFEELEEEAVDVDIKGKMSYWESPKDGNDTPTGRDSPPKDSEKPPPVILGNIKQGWQKRNRKVKVAEFIKELLSANCKRRDLKDIQDVKSETKKYLAGGMHAEETGTNVEKSEIKEKERVDVKNEENRKKTKKDAGDITEKKADDEFSFDDVVNPDEVKQLRDFSNFRLQVRPTNRRAAKSNPVRKLQQRDDLKTGTENFNDEDEEDEEDALPKPTAIGRLGRAIEPGDRKSKDINKFAVDALAGLAAKEDVSKITLKKTSKSRTGVSQEKSEHDGTASVMLLQIKGHRHMQTRLVEPSVESLNSADSFILVTEKFLHVWNGKDSNVMKKSKASELSNKILQYKLLNCNATVVTIIKDGGVNVGTGLTRTFWDILGGKKTVKGSKEIPKDSEYEKAVVSGNVVYSMDTSTEPTTLHKMTELCGKIPKIDMLDSDKAFVFDFGTEVYAWLGRTCDKATRNKAVDLAQEIYKSPFEVHNSLNPITPNMPKDDGEPRQLKRPSWALFGRMTERAETILFEQKFLDWPDVSQKIKMDKEKDKLNKNLSKGYAKRMAKIEKSEYQAVELVPYDGAKMAEEPPPIKLILEGVNVGRGWGSYDEIERRGLSVTTNSVTVYHSSEKESRQLEEKEWGHFYSAESYVIRWSYSVKASGIRSLKGGESKRDTTGRDQIAYFFWHGRDCSASGKGTSALATIELDSDKSPQIMVDEGHESACFLNMFDGQMIVHHGKPDEAKSIEEDNVFMYCVHNEDEKEICLTQVEARSSNLRSRSSFVVIIIDKTIGICVWHGVKSTKEKREGALRGAKRLASWFQDLFDIGKVDTVELEEGHEGDLFWEALDGRNDYGSLKNASGKCDNRVRLFTFLSTEGPFLAKEILNQTRSDHESPYPFRQAILYDATQPALFLVDLVHEMYLWQGWWPGNPEESESATTTGSAEFRWHRDRKLAMQSVQSYADSVGRQMSKAYVVNAGLEPVEFRTLFPFWEDHPDVTKLNLESGKVDGKKESMTELLARLSRDRYTLAELLVRPLPEGVDPLKMEMYLSDEEFKEVFKMTKDEFNKLPKWKKLDKRKDAGLF